MTCAAEIGERQHGDFRFDLKSPHFFRAQKRNLCQIFCRGLDVDRGVGKEEDAIFQHHHVKTGDAIHIRFHTDNLQRRSDGFRVGLGQAGDESVSIAGMHHHRPEVIAFENEPFRFAAGEAFAFSAVVQKLCVLRQFLAFGRIDDFDAFVEIESHLFDSRFDRMTIAQQNGMRHALIQHNFTRLQNRDVLAFRVDDPFRLFLGFVDDRSHDFARHAESGLQLFLVLL